MTTNSNKTLELNCEITKNDMFWVNMKILYSKPSLIIYAIFGLLLIANSIISAIDSFSITVLISLVLGILLTFSPVFGVLKGIYNIFYKNHTDSYSIKYVFTENQYSCTSGNHTVEIAWEDFRKYKTFKNAIILHSQATLVHIIPMSAFEGNQNQLLQLKEVLNSHLT